MNNLIAGMMYLLDGFNLIFKPGLKRFMVIPVLINLLLFIGLFFLLTHYISLFNKWFLLHLPFWLQWLGYILWFLFFISFFIFFIYIFVALTNFIAAPFNSLLAEKVELYLTGKRAPQKSFLTNVKSIPSIIYRQISLFLYYLPRALFLFILFFIPIIQAIAAFLWFLFSAWFITMTCIDYPTDNHHIPIKVVQKWLEENRALALGFGSSILFFTMIPIVNFFVLPAAVAGATKLWIEKNSIKMKTSTN